MGVTVESAYQALVNNDPSAWKIVQHQFESDVKAAITHIKSYDTKCKNELYNNLGTNVDRFIHEHPNIDDKTFSGKLYELAHKMRPEFLAQATVYGDMYGYNNHTLSCYNCKIMLHQRKKFNINIAYIDPKAGAPVAASVNSHYPRDFTNKVPIKNAQWILFFLSQHDCWTGMMAVGNGHNYWTDGNFIGTHYMQFLPETKPAFVLQLWAQQHLPCIRMKKPSLADYFKSDEELMEIINNSLYEQMPEETSIEDLEQVNPGIFW